MDHAESADSGCFDNSGDAGLIRNFFVFSSHAQSLHSVVCLSENQMFATTEKIMNIQLFLRLHALPGGATTPEIVNLALREPLISLNIGFIPILKQSPNFAAQNFAGRA
jgi:hypothetical protein